MKDAERIENKIDLIVDRYVPLGVRCDAYAHEVEIFIDSIKRDRSDPATKGRGAQLIRELCALADANDLPVELTHMRDEPGLGEYYAQFGLAHYEVPGGNPELASMRRERRSVVQERSPKTETIADPAIAHMNEEQNHGR